LFALKVVVNHGDGSGDGQEDFGFFSVPKKMAIWAELILIQVEIFTPFLNLPGTENP
jgi:hypothetical protein